MTEPTKQARQRCADLSNAVNNNKHHWNPAEFSSTNASAAFAFARHVQQTSDTMREIVRLLADARVKMADIDEAIALARLFILPDEVDPDLVEAREIVRSFYPEMPDNYSGRRVQAVMVAIKRRQA
jgi:histidinol-phosphate/aromatic aminotransferase/cobyric acid decarboxylase-like protein